MTPQTLNITGLLFDMGGVLTLFFFGLSHVVTLDGTNILAAQPNSVAEGEANKKEGRLHVLMSRLGLLLILIGFGLQLTANLVPTNGGNNSNQSVPDETSVSSAQTEELVGPTPKS